MLERMPEVSRTGRERRAVEQVVYDADIEVVELRSDHGTPFPGLGI